MLELVRGYAAAALDAAGREGSTDAVASDLADISRLLVSSEPLRLALTDGAISISDRSAVLDDLLSEKVSAEALAIVGFALHMERGADLSKAIEQLVGVAELEVERLRADRPVEPEPPMGRSGTYERLRGYGEWELEHLDGTDAVDELEDELFRLARIVEHTPELRSALSNADAPLAVRVAVLRDLIGAKVTSATFRLVAYVLRAGRVRALASALDYLVELAASERGRRVAEVRAAIELSDAERERLATALGRIVRRPVELRVVVDPSVLGGIAVQVGDTFIDGTVRHRLAQLRDALLQGV